MKTYAPPWRKVKTVALPGDEESVLSWLISQAVKRDGRLNPQELTTVLCTNQQLVYGMDTCFSEWCPNCGGFQWKDRTGQLW